MNSEPPVDAGMPPEADSPAPPMEDCVPVSALAMPDEKEQMQPPAVGDKVSYQVDGTISRIEGENAYIKKTSVNGEEIDEATETPKDDMAELESMAESQQEPGGF